MENDKSYFETEDIGGLTYPVVKRKKGSSKIDECPYCGLRHSHGETTGHRAAPCFKPNKSYVSISIKGIIIPQSRGYIIKEY